GGDAGGSRGGRACGTHTHRARAKQTGRAGKGRPRGDYPPPPPKPAPPNETQSPPPPPPPPPPLTRAARQLVSYQPRPTKAARRISRVSELTTNKPRSKQLRPMRRL